MLFDCSYSLLDDVDGRFAINTTSGVLTSQKLLDREDTALYHLTVVAKDHGNLAKSAEANITVYVDDVNDNVPQFEKQTYNKTLNNPTSLGTGNSASSYCMYSTQNESCNNTIIFFNGMLR